MDSFKRVNILGCPFDAVSFDETVQVVRNAVLHGKCIQIVPGSIDFVMKARRDPVFAKELCQVDLVIADGVPIVWAASLLGKPIKGRVSGTDLVWSCAEISDETGCSIALIGGKPGVAQRAADRLQERYPKSTLNPIPTPFPLGLKENKDLVNKIRTSNAKIVLAALGAPRQERWIQTYLGMCSANVGIGIGGAFDIICGDMPRAPHWMRDNGFEWLHRLTQEPKRLTKRYLIDDSPFLVYLFWEIVKRKFKLKGADNQQT